MNVFTTKACTHVTAPGQYIHHYFCKWCRNESRFNVRVGEDGGGGGGRWWGRWRKVRVGKVRVGEGEGGGR